MRRTSDDMGTVGMLAWIAVALLIVVAALMAWRSEAIRSEMKSLGRECLSSRNAVSSTIWGETATATYTESDTCRTATVTRGGREVVVNDFNISRIAGRKAGKAGVEFTKGLIEGVRGDE